MPEPVMEPHDFGSSSKRAEFPHLIAENGTFTGSIAREGALENVASWMKYRPSDNYWEDETMAETDNPSRGEVNAKLEAVEARLDGKLVTIDVKLDRLFDRVEAAVQASEKAETAAGEAQRSASNVKWNIVATAIGVIAILFAAWAIWSQGVEMVAGLFNVVPSQ